MPAEEKLQPLGACAELDELRRLGGAAVPELFGRYREKLLRMIGVRIDPRLVGKVDAEDVLQEVFMEVVRRFDYYLQHPGVPVFVWIRKIACQVLVNLHRRYLGAQLRDVRQEVSLDACASVAASVAALAAQLADSLTTPSQYLTRVENIALVTNALEQLDELDREVLVLRHLEELSNNEVACVLGIDKYAASKRYLRALERLKRLLPAAALPT